MNAEAKIIIITLILPALLLPFQGNAEESFGNLTTTQYALTQETTNSFKSWLTEKISRDRFLRSVAERKFSCRLLSLIIKNAFNQEKFVYIELNGKNGEWLKSYVFIESNINAISKAEAIMDKSMYVLFTSFYIDEKGGMKFQNISSMPLIDSEKESCEYIRYIRTHYKNAFINFTVSSTPKAPMSEQEKTKIVNRVKAHIVNYDLKTKKVHEEWGELPAEISVTIAPFDKLDTYIRYIYNNTTPYRIMRTVKINANGEIDPMFYFQSPGYVTSSENEYIDYRYNPDGGPTQYELYKDYFDNIEKNGIKITIPYSK